MRPFLKIVSGLSLALILSSCGSSGSSTPLAPTLSSIQTNIFNRSCALSGCHNDGAAQGNLRLTTGNSFSQLVGVTSDINPLTALAAPGDPDASLLIQKLEGPGSGDGDRMPLDETPLAQAEINVIREWIANGALNN